MSVFNWPEITLIILIFFKFIGDLYRAIPETAVKYESIGAMLGMSAYYAVFVWILYKGDFFA
jgi:hypothetical protein